MSRIAVRAIIQRGDKLLVMRRDKFGHRYYTLVGGAMKGGETPEQTLARELQEETSMKLTKLTPVFKDEAGDPYGPSISMPASVKVMNRFSPQIPMRPRLTNSVRICIRHSG
jgi:ADP-ribose pyrophosphatase YjhB (NUDIX family)